MLPWQIGWIIGKGRLDVLPRTGPLGRVLMKISIIIYLKMLRIFLIEVIHNDNFIQLRQPPSPMTKLDLLTGYISYRKHVKKTNLIVLNMRIFVTIDLIPILTGWKEYVKTLFRSPTR